MESANKITPCSPSENSQENRRLFCPQRTKKRQMRQRTESSRQSFRPCRAASRAFSRAKRFALRLSRVGASDADSRRSSHARVLLARQVRPSQKPS